MKKSKTKRRVGRPSKTYFTSMAQAAGATGIPYRTFQFAKNHGCDAFDCAGRVRLVSFINWMCENVHSESWDEWMGMIRWLGTYEQHMNDLGWQLHPADKEELEQYLKSKHPHKETSTMTRVEP